MNHRPFEDWILNEQTLNPEQKRGLQAHLLDCAHCSALNEVELALRSVKMAAPAAGFTARFQARLEQRRLRERRNRLIGVSVAGFGGAGFLLWLIAPYILQFIGSPAGWIAGIVSFLLAFFEMLRALGNLGSIFLRILPGFIPPIGWLMLLSTFSGFILLWMVSIWRLTRYTKGV